MGSKENRTIHYSFKVTEEESRIIQEKMKMIGITNQSSFIRHMVLKGLLVKLDMPEIREAVRLMGILSNNANQIARRLHEGGSIYETEVDEIVQEQKALRDMLSQILKRLENIGK